jgi:hypothetical protein
VTGGGGVGEREREREREELEGEKRNRQKARDFQDHIPIGFVISRLFLCFSERVRLALLLMMMIIYSLNPKL